MGGGTMEGLLERMSSEEYAYWKAFDFIHPIMDLNGEDQLRATALSLTINRYRKKGASAIKSDKLRLRPPLPTFKKQPMGHLKSSLMALVNMGKKKKEK